MNDLVARVAARHMAAQDDFSVGDEILFGKYKNKRGKIVRLFEDERGISSVEIEPTPKGRKKNRVIGLYKIWRGDHRKQAAYSKEFLDSVQGQRFRNPATGNKVIFKSLPEDEQRKIHDRSAARGLR